MCDCVRCRVRVAVVCVWFKWVCRVKELNGGWVLVNYSIGVAKGKRGRGISVSADVFMGQGRERTEKGSRWGRKGCGVLALGLEC